MIPDAWFSVGRDDLAYDIKRGRNPERGRDRSESQARMVTGEESG